MQILRDRIWNLLFPTYEAKGRASDKMEKTSGLLPIVIASICTGGFFGILRYMYSTDNMTSLAVAISLLGAFSIAIFFLEMEKPAQIGNKDHADPKALARRDRESEERWEKLNRAPGKSPSLHDQLVNVAVITTISWVCVGVIASLVFIV